MAEGISSKDLYQIINRAFSNWRKGIDVSASSEINIFTKKYQERLKNNPQIDVFEERPVLPQELKEVRRFLNTLESYRETLDVDAKNDYLSEENYRELALALDKYKNVLTPDNQIVSETISEYVKRYLPEYKDFFTLKDCLEEASSIYKRKPKKRGDLDAEECARKAYYFLKKVMKGEEIKNITPCPEKLELYQKSIKLVDCLTPKKYPRTFKFRLKRDLYNEIDKCATNLSADYKSVANEAKAERARFDKAIINVKDFIIRKYGENEWTK